MLGAAWGLVRAPFRRPPTGKGHGGGYAGPVYWYPTPIPAVDELLHDAPVPTKGRTAGANVGAALG